MIFIVKLLVISVDDVDTKLFIGNHNNRIRSFTG